MTVPFRHKQLPAFTIGQERQIVDEFRRVQRWTDETSLEIGELDSRVSDLESGGGGGGFIGGGGETFDNDGNTSFDVQCTEDIWRGVPLFGDLIPGSVNVQAIGSDRYGPTQTPNVVRAYGFVQFDVDSNIGTYDAFDVGIFKNTAGNTPCGYNLIISHDWEGLGRRVMATAISFLDTQPLISSGYGICIRSTQRTVIARFRSHNFWIDYE